MPSSQPTEMAHRLAAARAAYDGRRWADALHQFRECDALRPLAREDLVRLTWSAGMLDRDDDLLACCARLFEESEAAGDPASAAYWAFFHGFRLLALEGNASIGPGTLGAFGYSTDGGMSWSASTFDTPNPFRLAVNVASPAPEPSSMALMVLGLSALLAMRHVYRTE